MVYEKPTMNVLRLEEADIICASGEYSSGNKSNNKNKDKNGNNGNHNGKDKGNGKGNGHNK